MLDNTPFLEAFKLRVFDLDTKKADLFKGVLILSKKFPELVNKIQFELDSYALQKKQMRIANKKHSTANQPDFIDLSNTISGVVELELNDGRPRAIPNELLLYLLALRGCYGSISNQEIEELIKDSKTIKYIIEYYGCKDLKINTMRENLNIISPTVSPLVLKCQVQMILDELLDDFSEVLIDSTAVTGNTAYPTDITVLNKLLVRIGKCFSKLNLFGIEGFKEGNIEDLLKEINSLVTSISLSFGNNTKNVKQKRKKDAKKLFRRARKLIDYFLEQQLALQFSWENVNLPPDKAFALDKLWGKIEQDLEDVEHVFIYSALLLLKRKNIPNGNKLLSVADPDVGYIQKGGRVPVIGYKPQIALSGKGFICGYITPIGNASDTSQLIPVLEQVIDNTMKIPSLVSVDDGYSSEENLNDTLSLGIPTISFSGSKGKCITEDFWDTTINKYARNKRSAVESVMFTLKDGHNFGRLARRGIDAVNAEGLEKVIAYNFMQIIRVKERLKILDLAC